MVNSRWMRCSSTLQSFRFLNESLMSSKMKQIEKNRIRNFLDKSVFEYKNLYKGVRKSFFHTSRKILAMKDPYATLHINRDASISDIKKAYFKLAKQYHPDTNKEKGAQEKFLEIQQAYEILSDPKKRSKYDQYGSSAFESSKFGAEGPTDFEDFGNFSNMRGFPFDDLFGAFGFGGKTGTRSNVNEVLVGNDIEVQTSISFMEAAKGGTKSIHINPLVICKTCSGSGLKSGQKRSACQRCGGTGTRVHIMQGGFQVASTCEYCKGVGVTILPGSECWNCHGDGVIKEKKVINLDIPAGIEDGMRMRLAGEGNAPQTATSGARIRNGDLHVRIRVMSHPLFRRKGSDIFHTVTIPMTTAALGGTIKVPTLDDDVELKIPSGTATGDVIVMNGKGIERLYSNGIKGDIKYDFKVTIPKILSPYERTLLEQLALSMGDHTAKKDIPLNQAPDSNKKSQDGFLKRTFRRLQYSNDS
ncbi:chaperone DnaJ [Pneumocystis murina B123]|uniref:DnaJ homolog 1, mitochondrial n=1 Tax=Pneumocystis murina (strain B123) TaxID=1069680 RepID=M7P7G0_PNEMU|nr:chaperone DnaJ [Pneumocystis murina B123]EMR09780.1 chaperone DnaJ [Pneumocystis murina B123]